MTQHFYMTILINKYVLERQRRRGGVKLRTRQPGQIPVTTTVPQEIWAKAKANSVTIRSLVIDGWNSRQGMAGLLERQRELEGKVLRLAGELDRSQKQLWEYQRRGPLEEPIRSRRGDHN